MVGDTTRQGDGTMTIEEEIRRIVRDEIGRFFEGYKMVEPDTGGMTVEPVEKSPFADVVPEKPKASCTCLRHHHVVVNYNDTCDRVGCFCKSPADGRVQPPKADIDAFYCSGVVSGGTDPKNGCSHPRDQHEDYGCAVELRDGENPYCPCERAYGE